MSTLADALTQAQHYHRSGDLYQAEQLYRQILQTDPANAEALRLLGVLASQVGRPDLGVPYLQQAVRVQPQSAAAHADLAAAFQAMGRLAEAAFSYQQAVFLSPDDVQLLDNLGNVLTDQGQAASALPCYQKALQLQPGNAVIHNDLGIALAQLGRRDEAVARFREAIRLVPDYARALNNLGIVLVQQGQFDEAVAAYQRALQLQPEFAEAYNNLGNAYRDLRRFDEAVAALQQALRLRPNYPRALNNLGNAYLDRKQFEEATASFRQALQLSPNFPEAHNNLGTALRKQGEFDAALACYREALRQRPDFAEAQSNLGTVLREQGQLDAAAACYQEALRLRPDFAEAYNNLGDVRKDQGLLDEAVACARKARNLKPAEQAYHTSLLGTLLYHPGYDAPAILVEHRRWDMEHAQPLTPATSAYGNDPSPERRLRIGYVSPDFRDHVVGRNVWPLLRNHDRDQFEVTLYANQTRADVMTERFQQCAQHWCNIAGWPDDQVVDRIRQDGIDILVDLALHTADNRLLVFARKPAPVQVTFAGYPGTTGLSAIDYRLTDPYLDPPGEHDAWYVEASYRLPHSFWCFDPQNEEPAVAPLPAPAKGYVTFGCLNNFCKINDGVLELWARVLHAVTGSRLLLLTRPGSHRQRTLDSLARQGITSERVEFLTPRPRPEYLAMYHQVDIGLDAFPYNGHTSSLDAYWMGVPVLTLVGKTVVGRAGLSQLTNLGLQALAAATPEEFVCIAAELAGDSPRLEALRDGLRERMRQSPLMDATGFAGGIEQAYRVMWRKWCAQPHC